MNPALSIELVGTMASRWWMLIVRGAVAIAFGVLAWATPETSLRALLMLWGAYCVVDGVLCVLLASQRSIAGHTWGWLLCEGTVSLGAGFLALLTSSMSGLGLLSLIAVRATCNGIAEIAEAARVRETIRGEWLLAASGVLSIAFGVTMFVYRGAGALAAESLIAGYAAIMGALLLGLGMRMQKFRSRTQQT